MSSLISTFTQNLAFSEPEIEVILSTPLNAVLNSPELKQELDSLDVNLLRETLPTAGQVLAENLPPFYNWLKNELGVKRVPDSPDHTTKWVINFLHNQESINHLVELHRPVPHAALEQAVPHLVGLFDGVEDVEVRKEWEKAVAALCLVLVVDAREQEKLAKVC
ncbi:hypothetical protein H6G54_12430 [Anabaena cylindrica FACHB-243]|uniref:Uncharacterized protein n=1 Tax=Anabaena cylindrica (strain ATCC 27899 / PCC 7122) TaxID=272123 RepID=K9ZG35_ANACC|nr:MULTISPECIES: hypothetical protein [Anabaena]AFZ57552.1 hypothetical protein Anacy_2073 [Anabaena cylindrica PCC 7122]MBD2418489.1 hypothetical protein [Anabaena cylindrica FACHB-243]MBY5283700.1 hypothetical protein [Anabaena sp. CCAP 1446/1C]MBY5308476.1 hypothetical protein [Anabaena sp. CCAP 1446/1C]MCM2405083.1 hypothetical protein [Anabaena sp. CCAP 1446/1C]